MTHEEITLCIQKLSKLVAEADVYELIIRANENCDVDGVNQTACGCADLLLEYTKNG